MPLNQEIAWRDPADAFAAWSDDPYVAWLDSAAENAPRSRYSYLCVEPFQVLAASAGGDGVSLDGLPLTGDPFTALEQELGRWRSPLGTAAPVPFAGGAVGFLGYELGGQLERLPRRHPDCLGVPGMVFGFYDTVLAFDVSERRCWLLSSGLPEAGEAERERRAAARAEAVLRRLNQTAGQVSGRAATGCPAPEGDEEAWRPELTRADYEARVGRVLEYIRAGDIFQANFTMRFLAPRPPRLRAAELYLRLRAESPAPFAAFLGCGPRLALASASPERFLRLGAADRRVETRPIKGTRPRHPDPGRDEAAARELEASAKDRAENLMIVDLLRNDIGRVAEAGSVRVPSLFELERFASVHHLVSAVEGRLRAGLGPVDLLRAAFPGGSVTGAPKVRAMEVIDELEAARRGPYCGAVAWIGWDGAMDSSITIRTLVITPERVVAQAGGGIVADSEPAAEYEELLVKVRPLLRALGGGESGGARP